MKYWHPLTILTVGLAGAACAAGGGVAGRQSAGEAGAAMAPESAHVHETLAALPASGGPGYTAADVRFMQGMMGHHAQAVTMSEMAPTHGASDPLLRLAEKIRISQTDEIGLMRRWLEARGQAVPDERMMQAMTMPGMLTADQMRRLGAASGTEFDRLYLSYMIEHHRGALQMVETLFDSPGAAQDSDIFRFVSDVDADQRDEIWVMQTMLNEMDTNRGGRSR